MCWARRQRPRASYVSPPPPAMTVSMTSLKDIRTGFLEFFRRNDHEVVPSSPLVPRNDPTLLFTNAGMVQFKNVFTGQEKRAIRPRRHGAEMRARRRQAQRPRPRRLHRAPPHLLRDAGEFLLRRLFQGRRDQLAWKLVTKDYGLAKDRLLATVYAEDDEAFTLWRKIAGLPESRVIRIATSDNFWSMGDTGPCGPCSEIFYDHGPHIPGGPPGSPDEDGDRFIEIWNLVFMQYEQFAGGVRAEPAEALRRHRHGARAHHRGAPGRARQLRHRPVPPSDRRVGRAFRRRRSPARTRSAIASSPIICARRAS